MVYKKNLLLIRRENRKAFSLIELIFAIVVIGVISSIAIPNLMSIDDNAKVSAIEKDVNSIISAIENYYIVNKKIDKISDAIILNTTVWNITDKIVSYKENNKNCITIELNTDKISLTIDSTAGNICKKLSQKGIKTLDYNLE